MSGPDGQATLRFTTQVEFEVWLESQHAEHPPVWLEIAKKGAAFSTVTYAEAVDSALCFGWIDGQKASADEEYYLQRFSRRSARSRWSKINRDKSEALIAAGRMQPAGLDEVDRAKADGRWDAAYAGPATAVVPADLQAELDADPALAKVFKGLNSANRFAIIWRLNDAKRPETRARRLEKFLDMLRKGERIH